MKHTRLYLFLGLVLLAAASSHGMYAPEKYYQRKRPSPLQIPERKGFPKKTDSFPLAQKPKSSTQPYGLVPHVRSVLGHWYTNLKSILGSAFTSGEPISWDGL